jgi:enoyl-CoA hydratase
MVDHVTAQRLSRLVGPGRAAALLLAADELDASAAVTAGLAQRSGTPADAADWARQIAALAPLTVAGHKLALRTVDPPPGANPAVDAAFATAWASADLLEGRSAYAERRPPRFEGR